MRLAEIFEGTVDNGKENASLAKERLRHLHAVLRRLTGERLRHGEAVKAAVAWQESLEELRYGVDKRRGRGGGVVWCGVVAVWGA